MGVLQAAIAAAIALILAPGYSFAFDVIPKVAVLLLGTALLLVLEVSRRGRGGAWNGARKRAPLLSAFWILSGLMAASLALSSTMSVRPGLSVFGSGWRQFGAITQVAVLLFAGLAMQRGRALPLLRGVAIASSVMAAYGICQYLGWDPVLPAAAYHVGEGEWTIVRPPGTLGYVSYFATWLLVATYLGVLLAGLESSAAWRRIAMASAGLSAVGVVVSGSRAAMLGLVAGAVVLVWMRRSIPMRRIAFAAAMVACIGVSVYYSPLGWNLRSRARWFAEDPWGGARGLLWRDSARMVLGHPLAGYGPEVFLGAFPRYESRELAAAYPDFEHESPHNILLDVFVGQGVIGFGILVGFIVLGFAAVRRLRLKNGGAAGALGAALTGGFLSQQFTVFTMPTALILFTALGIAIGLEEEWEFRHSNRISFPALAAALALAFVAVRLMSADAALARTKGAITTGSIPDAVADFREYQRFRLPGSSAELWFSRAAMSASGKSANPVVQLRWFSEGARAAVAAPAIAEDPFNAWYNAAIYYAANNDAASTEQALRRAIEARPRWFKPHWMLSRLYWTRGNPEAAEREAALAVDLDGGKHAEVRETLSEIRGHRAAALQVFQK